MAALTPIVRHLLVCLEMEYDLNDPHHPYSLRRIVSKLSPPTGSSYPLTADVLWVFAQFANGHGSHRLVIDVVRIDGPDVSQEVLVKSYGLYVIHLPDPLTVQNRGWKLRRVPFRRPGLYEFRVRTDGSPDALAVEPVVLE